MSTFNSLWKGKSYLKQSTMLNRDPLTIGTFILSGIDITGASVFIASTVGYIATTLVTSWLLTALTTSGSSLNNPISQGTSLSNSVVADADGEIVYGRIRKGGVVTYMEATGSTNQYLHMIICFACHTIDAFESIYINDVIVTLDANGFATAAPWNSKVRIKLHLGSPTQTADSNLLSESAQITSAFQGKGIAYMYVRLEYDENVFANGIPLFTAVIRGKKVFDSRVPTTVWSANAALVVRDYLQASYGPEILSAEVDTTAFAHAADVCDASITPVGGTAQAMFTIDAVFTTGQTYRDVMQAMMTACGGSLYHSMGLFKLIVAEYNSPVKTFTLDNLRSEINIDTKVARHDNFNSITGTFNDASQGYIVADFPKIIDTNFLTEDGGIDNPIDMSMPCITDVNRAIRVCTIALRRAREQITFTATFDMSALDVDVGDFVNLTIGRYGWVAKVFQVNTWSFGVDSDGALVIEMTLRESSSTAFSTTLNSYIIVNNNSLLPDYKNPTPPTSLVVTNVGYISSAGYFIPSIHLTWTASTDKFVTSYIVSWKEHSASVYKSMTVKTTEADIQLTKSGILYDLQVQSVNVYGIPSTALTGSITAAYDTVAPANPTGIGAIGVMDGVLLTWTNPTDSDFDHVEIYVNTVNNSATATLVQQTKGIFWKHDNLGSNALRYYWFKAVDSFGNRNASFTTVVSATSRYILTSDVANGQFTLSYCSICAPALINTSALTRINTFKFNRAVGYPTIFAFQIQVMPFDESSDLTVQLKTGSRIFFQNKMGVLQNQQNLVSGNGIDNDLSGGSTIYDLYISRPNATLVPTTFVYQNILTAYQMKR